MVEFIISTVDKIQKPTLSSIVGSDTQPTLHEMWEGELAKNPKMQ